MKKIKSLALILLAIFILIFSSILLVGNYFFNYSIVRKGSDVGGTNRNVPSNKSDVFKTKIEENQKRQNEQAILWYDSVEKKVLEYYFL